MWSCPWMPPFVPQQTRLHIRTRGSSRAVASCSHDKSAWFRQSKLATASKRRVSQALRRPKRSLEDAFLLAVWSWQISLVVPALTGRTPRAARCSSNELETRPVLTLVDTAELSGTCDPLIQALVDKLPKPNAVWSVGDRAKWLKAAAMAFDLLYKPSQGHEADLRIEEKPSGLKSVR